jgi:hypothetical protein
MIRYSVIEYRIIRITEYSMIRYPYTPNSFGSTFLLRTMRTTRQRCQETWTYITLLVNPFIKELWANTLIPREKIFNKVYIMPNWDNCRKWSYIRNHEPMFNKQTLLDFSLLRESVSTWNRWLLSRLLARAQTSKSTVWRCANRMRFIGSVTRRCWVPNHHIIKNLLE